MHVQLRCQSLFTFVAEQLGLVFFQTKTTKCSVAPKIKKAVKWLLDLVNPIESVVMEYCLVVGFKEECKKQNGNVEETSHVTEQVKHRVKWLLMEHYGFLQFHVRFHHQSGNRWIKSCVFLNILLFRHLDPQKLVLILHSKYIKPTHINIYCIDLGGEFDSWVELGLDGLTNYTTIHNFCSR